MQKFIFYKLWLPLLLPLLLLFPARRCWAPPLLELGKGGRTTITANEADIYISKKRPGTDVVVFTGNVDLDNQNVHLSCDKMAIYIDRKDTEGRPRQAANSPKGTGSFEDISRIICIGNVVITQKSYDSRGQRTPANDRKGLGGRATYNRGDDKVTLMDNPKLIQRDQVFEGEIVTFHNISQLFIEE